MKGKRHTTEEKIRILRKADTGTNVQSICREHQISEQTFYRWKKEFGMTFRLNLLGSRRLY